MKNKIFALILAFAFILSGCAEEIAEVSSQIEGEVSEESQEAYVPQNKTCISVGKPYQTVGAANELYYDFMGQQLTDGQKASDLYSHYIDYRMVGYSQSSRYIIDLGEDGKNIVSLSARSLEMYEAGVGLASKVSFSGSNDNKVWFGLGSALFIPKGNKQVVTATVDLEAPVDYRYIKVTVLIGSGNAFYFIDEIEIFADVPQSTEADSITLSYNGSQLDRNAWKSLSTGEIVCYQGMYNVAEKKSYVYNNCEFDEDAPKNTEYLQDDLRTFLTNGVPTGMSAKDNVWVGISGKDGKNPSVTIDLQKSYDNVFGFRVNTLGTIADIDFPDYIDYYGSQNGRDYYFIGRVYAPISGTNFAYPFYSDEFLKMRYLRFEIGGGNMTWIEEVEILAGYGSDYTGEIYKKLNFPKVTEDIYWDKSDADYTKRQNLLLGLEHQISTSFYADANKYTDERVLGSIDTKCLTDGKRSNSIDAIDNGSWFFAPNSHGEINIFYDLGRLSSVDTVVVDFMERVEWGINRPEYCDVYLSDDGENWYKVGDHDALGKKSHYGEFMEYEFKLDKSYAARFVRFRLETNGWMLLDELSVYGKKEVGSSKRLEKSGIQSVKFYINSESAEYATTENNPIKANDINLIYLSQKRETTLSEDFLLPMVAYLDEDGVIKDTFIDGFLYLPQSPLPSGIAPHLETIKSDWEWLFETTFHGVSGFDRLDEVVEEVKNALGLTDYKVQVYPTILTVLETQTDFGDVDGDGKSENCYYAEDREKVVRWYVGKCLEEFEKGDYKNLELGGFYWMHEEVVESEQGEAIITQTASIVHEMGSYFLWIPYFNAPRYYIGYDMGFDLVNVQANMVFNLNTPKWQIDNAASVSELRGMAVEMEHTWQATFDTRYAKRYLEYLTKGYVYGYHEAINIYYDDGGNFYSMGISDDPLCRLQYDATYHYTKGDLEYKPKARADAKLEAEKNSVLIFKLEGDNVFTEFAVASMPKNGCVSIASDGSLVYYPDKDFVGTDKFTYTYNNLLGESEECVIEITVK